MKNLKKTLSLVLALVMVFSLMATAAVAREDYNDEDSITAAFVPAVDLLYNYGIMVGSTNAAGETNFRPSASLKRSEVAKMAYYVIQSAKEDAALAFANAGLFTDVPASHWAAGYINYLAATEVVAGKGAGKFDPDGTITGYEALKIFLGALGYNSEVSKFTNQAGETGNAWALRVLAAAQGAGLLDKLAGIDPSQPVTREQVAQITYNALYAKVVTVNENGKTYNVSDTALQTAKFNATDYTALLVANEYAGIYGQGKADEGKAVLRIANKVDDVTSYYNFVIDATDEMKSLEKLGFTFKGVATLKFETADDVTDNKFERIYVDVADSGMNSAETKYNVRSTVNDGGGGGDATITASGVNMLKYDVPGAVVYSTDGWAKKKVATPNETDPKAADGKSRNAAKVFISKDSNGFAYPVATDKVNLGDLIRYVDNNGDFDPDIIMVYSGTQFLQVGDLNKDGKYTTNGVLKDKKPAALFAGLEMTAEAPAKDDYIVAFPIGDNVVYTKVLPTLTKATEVVGGYENLYRGGDTTIRARLNGTYLGGSEISGAEITGNTDGIAGFGTFMRDADNSVFATSYNYYIYNGLVLAVVAQGEAEAITDYALVLDYYAQTPAYGSTGYQKAWMTAQLVLTDGTIGDYVISNFKGDAVADMDETDVNTNLKAIKKVSESGYELYTYVKNDDGSIALGEGPEFVDEITTLDAPYKNEIWLDTDDDNIPVDANTIVIVYNGETGSDAAIKAFKGRGNVGINLAAGKTTKVAMNASSSLGTAAAVVFHTDSNAFQSTNTKRGWMIDRTQRVVREGNSDVVKVNIYTGGEVEEVTLGGAFINNNLPNLGTYFLSDNYGKNGCHLGKLVEYKLTDGKVAGTSDISVVADTPWDDGYSRIVGYSNGVVSYLINKNDYENRGFYELADNVEIYTINFTSDPWGQLNAVGSTDDLKNANAKLDETDEKYYGIVYANFTLDNGKINKMWIHLDKANDPDVKYVEPSDEALVIDFEDGSSDGFTSNTPSIVSVVDDTTDNDKGKVLFLNGAQIEGTGNWKSRLEMAFSKLNITVEGTYTLSFDVYASEAMNMQLMVKDNPKKTPATVTVNGVTGNSPDGGSTDGTVEAQKVQAITAETWTTVTVEIVLTATAATAGVSTVYVQDTGKIIPAVYYDNITVEYTAPAADGE